MRGSVMLPLSFRLFQKKPPKNPLISEVYMKNTNDGVTHINVYSKGRTELGKWMSNFTYEPINTVDGSFTSIEGYWYWLGTRNDKLKTLHGFLAKKVGRESPNVVSLSKQDFQAKIEAAIHIKASKRPDMIAQLKQCGLPLDHYYVFNGTEKDAGFKWILDIWNNIRNTNPLF